MTNFFKIVGVLFFCVILSNCQKSDSATVSIRDYTEQYNADIVLIEAYLKTHKYSVDADQNVTFSDASTDGSDAIWYNPNLTYRTVTYNSIDVKVYYIKLQEGVGESPTNVDNALVAYKGISLDGTVFDFNNNPTIPLYLPRTILGWSEILPKFKTGTITENTNGTSTYANFGAGLMFLPSGVAYFNNALTNLTSYSPIIFSFKLFNVSRNDQDGDTIPSYLEDINGDGYLYNLASGVVNPDDTDGDEIPNFLDTDDDGDQQLTKSEVRYLDSRGDVRFYPYQGAAADNPLTPYVDESKGIPSRTGTAPNFNFDYTTPTRLRRHLDPTW